MIKSGNEEWGFFGTVRTQGHGERSPELYDAMASWLIDHCGLTEAQAIEALDGKPGRHLADAIGERYMGADPDAPVSTREQTDDFLAEIRHGEFADRHLNDFLTWAGFVQSGEPGAPATWVPRRDAKARQLDKLARDARLLSEITALNTTHARPADSAASAAALEALAATLSAAGLAELAAIVASGERAVRARGEAFEAARAELRRNRGRP